MIGAARRRNLVIHPHATAPPDAQDPAGPLCGFHDTLDPIGGHRLKRRQERHLVAIRLEPLVKEDAVPLLPRRSLKRQGNEVAESARGQRTLVGEEGVLGFKADLRPANTIS